MQLVSGYIAYIYREIILNKYEIKFKNYIKSLLKVSFSNIASNTTLGYR